MKQRKNNVYKKIKSCYDTKYRKYFITKYQITIEIQWEDIMANYRAFDVLGPIMVGPSSSHTAGAARISKAAMDIFNTEAKKVEFLLHGSFGATYKGHGTDKALLGGFMGFEPSDERIQRAFEIADEKGIEYKFTPFDLGEKFHPNTVKIIITKEDGEEEEVVGSSIGGGAFEIVQINGIDVKFEGRYPMILLQYHEQKGVIAEVSGILYKNNYNIESINTLKDKLLDIVTLTVELEEPLREEIKKEIFSSGRYIIAKYVGV